MDQDIILKAIEKHMDLLEKIFAFTFILAVAALWAGIRRADDAKVRIFGIEFDRKHAYSATGTVFVLTLALFIFVNLRVAALFQGLEEPAVLRKGFTVITTHSWALNPYSLVGTTPGATLISSFGLGLLVTTWWVCNTALDALRAVPLRKIPALPVRGIAKIAAVEGLFLLLGVSSVRVIWHTQQSFFDHLKCTYPDLASDYGKASATRERPLLLGTALGSAIWAAAAIWRGRLEAEAAQVSSGVVDRTSAGRSEVPATAISPDPVKSDAAPVSGGEG